jgi:hypothetical protein
MSYSSQVIADGATSYWRLGETSGTTAVDTVGGVNGTISGGVTYGQVSPLSDGNTAMAFNGTTGKIVTGNITVQAAFTVEGWIKSSDATNQFPMFSNRGAPAGVVYCGLTNGVMFLFSDGQTPTSVLGVKIVTNNQWHHVAYVSSGALTSLYVDGALDNSGAQTHVLATGPGGIGFDASGGGFWPGSIDEVAVYPTALTPTQIANHFIAGAISRDLTTLLKNHMVVLRAAGGGGALGVDSTTRFTKNIPTMRSGVTVPDCDLPTEIALYVTANG